MNRQFLQPSPRYIILIFLQLPQARENLGSNIPLSSCLKIVLSALDRVSLCRCVNLEHYRWWSSDIGTGLRVQATSNRGHSNQVFLILAARFDHLSNCEVNWAWSISHYLHNFARMCCLTVWRIRKSNFSMHTFLTLSVADPCLWLDGECPCCYVAFQMAKECVCNTVCQSCLANKCGFWGFFRWQNNLICKLVNENKSGANLTYFLASERNMALCF